MDWSLFFSAGAFGIMLVSAISGATFFIVKLMITPLKDDIEEIKSKLTNVRTDQELHNTFDLKVAQHKEQCVPLIRDMIDRHHGCA